ncbi:MAG: FAD-linked oxidase C-terminal domain-containing protein [Desulfobacteraceae bacterium]|jgi:glycolate oxidase
MIADRVFKELSRILGPNHLTTRQDDLVNFATDATKLTFMPDAVAFPGNSEEISRILVLANKEDFPVIPRGAGSGKSGGALPVKGGLVLAMDRLNRILSIDPHNLIAKVEPGVITARLQKEVEKFDLYYPPDPASMDISTIGGNVAECAGGLSAVKYGVTRDYVLGLTIVLPTGEIIKTGVETAKGVVGYDLTRLIVGSEGTLAVITVITLRLIPKPASTKTMMAFFHDLSLAVQTVSDIIRSKIVPTALEFMDRLCIDCVRDELPLDIPTECNAVLLIEIDGDEVLTRREAKKVKEACIRSGAIHVQSASGRKAAERLWDARRNVSPCVYKLRPDKVSEDIVVPRSRMAELVSFLDQLGEKYKLPMPAYGHAGDGNIHVNMMFDKSVPGDVKKVDAAVRELFRKVVAMNGTISGEHGVGMTKAPYLEMEISRPSLELMARLKKAFDPKGILNPGKIFPERT